MRAYKVLRREKTLKGEVLCSCRTHDVRWRVDYKIDGKTYPKRGRLLVFRTLRCAKAFAWDYETIWLVKAYKPIAIELLAVGNEGSLYKWFWENREIVRLQLDGRPIDYSHPRFRRVFYAPEGTYGCESLQLVRRVRDGQQVEGWRIGNS